MGFDKMNITHASYYEQARIQDSEGGVSYIQKGGGVRTGISGADPNCCRALGKSTSNTNCRQPWGGGPNTPKNLYPRMMRVRRLPLLTLKMLKTLRAEPHTGNAFMTTHAPGDPSHH